MPRPSDPTRPIVEAVFWLADHKRLCVRRVRAWRYADGIGVSFTLYRDRGFGWFYFDHKWQADAMIESMKRRQTADTH